MINLNATPSQSELTEIIRRSIENSDKPDVLIFGGHFPYVASAEGVTVPDYWSEFTPHTLALACETVHAARAAGKQASIALVVDDHHYIHPGTPAKFKKTAKRDMYRAASAEIPQLPGTLQYILEASGLGTDVLVQQDQGKHERHSSRLISESQLLQNAKTRMQSPCGTAYQQFLETYAPADRTQVISMIPSPCFGNVCDVVLREQHEREAVHAYFLFDRDFERDVPMSRIYERGDVRVQVTGGSHALR